MKGDRELAIKWLKRARSSLELARIGQSKEEVYYEDLCFNSQQAVEKSLKALLIYSGIQFRKTHSIAELLTLLKDSINIPKRVEDSVELTQYVITTRYPGDWEKVNQEEYENSLRIADDVYEWAEKIMEEE